LGGHGAACSSIDKGDILSKVKLFGSGISTSSSSLSSYW